VAISQALAPVHVGFPSAPAERERSARRQEAATGQETGLPAEGRRDGHVPSTASALRGELQRATPPAAPASLGVDGEGMEISLAHTTRIYISPLTSRRGIDVYRTLQDTTGLVDEYAVFRVDVYA